MTSMTTTSSMTSMTSLCAGDSDGDLKHIYLGDSDGDLKDIYLGDSDGDLKDIYLGDSDGDLKDIYLGDSDGDLKDIYLGDSDGDKVKVDNWEGKMPGSLTLSANDLGWSCELFPYAINGQPVILLEGGAGIDGWWKLFIYQDSTDCYVEANVYGLDATNAFEEDDIFMSLSLPQKAAYLWNNRKP